MRGFIISFLSSSALTLFLFLCLCVLYNIVAFYNNKPSTKDFNIKKQAYIPIFLLIFSINFVVLLANFPGLGSGDSVDIVNQALGNSTYSTRHRYDGLSNHHSVFFTFLY